MYCFVGNIAEFSKLKYFNVGEAPCNWILVYYFLVYLIGSLYSK